MFKWIKAFGYPHAEGIWLHIVCYSQRNEVSWLKRHEGLRCDRTAFIMILVVRLMWILYINAQSSVCTDYCWRYCLLHRLSQLETHTTIRTFPVNLKKMQFPESIDVWDGKPMHVNLSEPSDPLGNALLWHFRIRNVPENGKSLENKMDVANQKTLWHLSQRSMTKHARLWEQRRISF